MKGCSFNLPTYLLTASLMKITKSSIWFQGGWESWCWRWSSTCTDRDLPFENNSLCWSIEESTFYIPSWDRSLVWSVRNQSRIQTINFPFLNFGHLVKLQISYLLSLKWEKRRKIILTTHINNDICLASLLVLWESHNVVWLLNTKQKCACRIKLYFEHLSINHL